MAEVNVPIISQNDKKTIGLILLSFFIGLFTINFFYEICYCIGVYENGLHKFGSLLFLLTYLVYIVALIVAFRNPHFFTVKTGQVCSILLLLLYSCYIIDYFTTYANFGFFIFFKEYTPIVLKIVEVILFAFFIFSLKTYLLIKISWCVTAILMLGFYSLLTKENFAVTKYLLDSDDSISFDYLEYKIQGYKIVLYFLLILSNLISIILTAVWMKTKESRPKQMS